MIWMMPSTRVAEARITDTLMPMNLVVTTAVCATLNLGKRPETIPETKPQMQSSYRSIKQPARKGPKTPNKVSNDISKFNSVLTALCDGD